VSGRCVVALVAAFLVAIPGTAGPAGKALAAFELRDASPAALGAVSLDLDPEPMFDPGREERSALRFAASHAALLQVAELTAEQATASYAIAPGSIDLSLLQLGIPGQREDRIRIRVAEPAARTIAVGFEAERLDLALEGEPAVGGWSGGVSARVRVPLRLPRGTVEVEVVLVGDRLWRSSGLCALGVDSSLPVTVRLRAAGASAAWMDRWESDGRHSPRLVVEIALGRSAKLRMGRGQSPGRTGAALGVRLGKLETLVGRLDETMGGSVSGVSIGLVL
jgi:hypothetical protein